MGRPPDRHERTCTIRLVTPRCHAAYLSKPQCKRINIDTSRPFYGGLVPLRRPFGGMPVAPATVYMNGTYFPPRSFNCDRASCRVRTDRLKTGEPEGSQCTLICVRFESTSGVGSECSVYLSGRHAMRWFHSPPASLVLRHGDAHTKLHLKSFVVLQLLPIPCFGCWICKRLAESCDIRQQPACRASQV